MLNLSDKDLDRLSKEAAQEYEPGEILGPNSWEKLEIRLDSDLGRVSPNPLRHIRRFPFYYAPALLVFLGISYYYLTKHPQISHYTVKNSTTNQISTNPANSTPATLSSANTTGPAATPGSSTGNASSKPVSGSASSRQASSSASTGRAAGSASTGQAAGIAVTHAVAGSASSDPAAGGAPGPHNDALTSPRSSEAAARPTNRLTVPSSGRGPKSSADRLNSKSGAQSHSPGSRTSHTHSPNLTSPGYRTPPEGNSSNPFLTPLNANSPSSPQPSQAGSRSHELERSKTGGLSAVKARADISDSALRAFTLKSMPPPPIRRALYIKRNWQFGLIAAPDFASVNSLAGDKPGSTLGITVDYQFAPRWYISSGLLLDRRNYAARGLDFHPPDTYYQGIGVMPQHVEFAKGSFQMLEIPLNLRYDFSITGSTLFFASTGLSSFLFAADYGNCYASTLSGSEVWGFKHPGTGNYLFSTMNLTMGVETGLSNSMSILVAPYLKMPLGPIGFGQVQMSSVGITFGVKWAPVTSRRRR